MNSEEWSPFDPTKIKRGFLWPPAYLAAGKIRGNYEILG